MTWLWCHPKAVARQQNLYRCICLQTLPHMVNSMGAWLDRFAVDLSLKEMTALPILKARSGLAEDLNLAKSRLMHWEAYID